MSVHRMSIDARPVASLPNVVPIRSRNDKRWQVPDGDEALPCAAIEKALSRVLASDTFRRSRRHRDFLAYIVEAVIAGRGHNLKEVVIGLDVFDRALDGYDPQRDSIVRVEARRLRKRLLRYYALEGARDEVEIRLHGGSYVPVMAMRSSRPMPAKPPLFLVLPFIDVSSTTLSIGLADQLLDRLGSVPSVHVVAPMEAVRLRAHATAFDALRRGQGIDYVVDGSIVRAGARIRCIVHLSRTLDRRRLWSSRFDFDEYATEGGSPDLFAFQDRIADALFDAVKAERGEG